MRLSQVPRAIARRLLPPRAVRVDDAAASYGPIDLAGAGVVEINGERFVAVPYWSEEDHGDDLVLIKSVHFLHRYMSLAASVPSAEVVVELGIYKGGSAGFLFELYQPKHLVAFELSTERAASLDAYIERRELGDRIHLHYGTDQADQAALISAINAVGRGRCVDVVSDDASHQYAPTRAAFEAIFPLMREGGRYIIEDWTWSHVPAFLERHDDAYADEPALTNLLVEIVMLLGSRPDILRAVTVENGMFVVTRGAADVDVPMRLESLISNRGKPYVPAL